MTRGSTQRAASRSQRWRVGGGSSKEGRRRVRDCKCRFRDSKWRSLFLFVCGPPPLYKAVCGPKGTKDDPKAQGELGGLLKDMGYAEEAVFKF